VSVSPEGSSRVPVARLVLSQVILVIAVSALIGSTSHGRTWYIKADGTGDALTIQAGVDSAAAGDIVLVGPGTFADTVHVEFQGSERAVNAYLTKSISLRSECGATSTQIDGTHSDICVLLDGVGNTAEIRGFDFTFNSQSGGGCLLAAGQRVLQKSTNAPLGKVAVWCHSSSPMISENLIHDAGTDTGVHMESSPATITANVFVGVGIGVNAESGSDAAISQNSFENCLLAIAAIDASPIADSNKIWRTDEPACRGIDFIGTGSGTMPTPVISNNTIDLMQNEGIWCAGVAPAITGNTVRQTGGVSIISCGSATFSGNVLIANSYGVVIQGTPVGSIENNTFDANDVGISITQGSNPLVARNIVYRGGVGISCFFLVAPTFSCNNVYGTTVATYGGDCTDQTGINGNLSLDPQFCGLDGTSNYNLQSDSPCAPGNHPQSINCGVIGARPSACGTVSIKATSWGALKGLYR